MTGTGEWLLANGLGGYALGPRTGPPGRGYHGWLVAATRPPDGRTLLVGAIQATLVVDGVETRLEEIDIATGVAARGSVRVRLDVTMPRAVNAVVLRWTRVDVGDASVALRVVPLLAGRDHHPGGATSSAPRGVAIEPDRQSARVTWEPGVPELRVATDGASIARAAGLVRLHYPEEAARGIPPDELLHVALAVEGPLARGASLTLVLGTDAGSGGPIPSPADATAVFAAADERRAALLRAAGPPAASSEAVAALVLAADRFLVQRPDPRLPDPDRGVTVIAGYPWFGDWGRDTMISLPGLALSTGRHDEAARILRTWADLVRDGLLPNHFPEAGGGLPAYHAIDAPLWFVHALGAWVTATGDPTLAQDLRPAVEGIVQRYRDGTRFGIGMDHDGLVRGGEPGLQLTWMDAKVDGVVITPRHGKPVEIQALWVEALRLASGWAEAGGDLEAARAHEALAERAARSFRARFFDPSKGWLADVIDGPDGDDASLRPNQLLALSLVDDLVDGTQARSILDAVGRHLLVPGGVRTLAPFEPAYRDAFQGPPVFRDSAYHQGPAWTWLLGPWITAVTRHRGAAAGRAELARALDALDPDRTGAIPELIEPEPPHESRGCPWQAWGVAELLRCAVSLAR